MSESTDEIERILASVEDAAANRMEPAAIIGLTEAIRVLNKQLKALKSEHEGTGER